MTNTPTSNTVRALAPAKINPYLAVLGPRSDGYHELETTLLAISLCDELEVGVDDSGSIALDVEGPFASSDVPTDERNLVWRAAERALELARTRFGVARSRGLSIRLVKRIPSQAGLGGGSSDAAAALLATERALSIEIDPLERARILAQLGSDCAFFAEAARSGYARCLGRGERVETLPAPSARWTVALVTPTALAPTELVYRQLAGTLRDSKLVPRLQHDSLEGSVVEARSALYNRLELAALSAVPELRLWRDSLDRIGLEHFRLSGSGSSFFGLYDSHSQAGADLELLERTARSRGLGLRGSWLVSPASHGARILP